MGKALLPGWVAALVFTAGKLVFAQDQTAIFACAPGDEKGQIPCSEGVVTELAQHFFEIQRVFQDQYGAEAADQLLHSFAAGLELCNGDRPCRLQRQIEAARFAELAGTSLPLSDALMPHVRLPKEVEANPDFPDWNVIEGRCHMGECGYIRVLGWTFLNTSPDGVLLRIRDTAQWVAMPFDEEETPQYDAFERPRLYPEASQGSLVYCSSSRPIVGWEGEDGSISVELLRVGDSANVYGHNYDTHLFYWAACHGRFYFGYPYTQAISREAQLLGYDLDKMLSHLDENTFSDLEALQKFLKIKP